MNVGQKAIVAGLAKAAKQYGFRNVRGTNYYLGRPETVCVVNLQKSRWGPQYDLNAGVWLTRFGVMERPPEYKCQIRWRIDNFLDGDVATQFREALDLDIPFSDSERSSVIEKHAGEFGFRLLANCDDEAATLKFINKYDRFLWLILNVRSVLEGAFSNG